MKRWIEPDPAEVPAEFLEKIGGHPLVAHTLWRRGMTDPVQALAFLDPRVYRPASAWELPGMEQAVERLFKALKVREKICVWGDFDVDGQTSTTLLVSTLQELGADVFFHIPLRDTESHGIKLPALQQALGQGAQLVLTCDTGIGEHEPIAYAQSQGVDVIVTDHHALPAELPQAHTMINPQMLPPQHPLRTLPGVGVAYKLAEALYERAGRSGEAEKNLDLVALGIVADVAVQRGDTRYLLQRGLEALRRTQRVGLQALMEVADLDPGWLSEEHIAFNLGPRLNALGRLADANLAVELLTTGDLAKAQVMATQLEGLNARRKWMCDQVFEAAMDQLEQDPALLEDAALVLAHPSWPPGVIGIVAARLVDHYNRPVVLIATPPNELGRGSARSVAGCDIAQAIAAHSDMLKSFGGHPMAAGLAIELQRIPEFRRALSRTVSASAPPSEEAPLHVDGYLRLDEISMQLVADLERLAPFGAGNRPLTLVSKELTLTNPRLVGRNSEHRQLIIKDQAGNAQRVIWWWGSEWELPQGAFDLAYALRASNYQGRREVQVEWLDWRPGPGALAPSVRPALEVVDHRQQADALLLLRQLQKEGVQIWCEAKPELDLRAKGRHELSAAPGLAIVTIPPGPQVLQEALEQARPHKVHLFALNAGMDEAKPFLNRLAGLLKFALSKRDGEVQLTKLAAATAQTHEGVRAGIAWLEAKGFFIVAHEEGDDLQIAKERKEDPAKIESLTLRLQALLEETAAYRAYFLQADKDRLVSP